MFKTEYGQQSILKWTITSLGSFYIIMLPLAAFISFIVVLVLVKRGNGQMAATSLVLAVFAPTLIGVIAYMQSITMSHFVLASSGGTPDPNKIAEITSAAIIVPLVAMLLSVPAYVVAAVGSFFRSFASNSVTTTNSLDTKISSATESL